MRQFADVLYLQMLSSSVVLVLSFLTAAFAENDAAVVIQRDYYNPWSNYIKNTQYLRDTCCIIPTCDDSGQCHKILSCGYVCRLGQYRPENNYNFTSGYRLKEYYMKEDCHFGECKMYKFLCSHCPNPEDDNFSIYTVRIDCKNCYSYMWTRT